MKLVCLLLCSTLLVFVSPKKAVSKTLWSDFSLTLLQGKDYEVGDNEKKVATFEFAAGNNWGDQFFFLDYLSSDNGDHETYFEWSPRYQLMTIDQSSIKALFIASTIESSNFSGEDGSSNSFINYLVGLGSSFDIPYFNYAKLNLYRRNNEQSTDNYQATFTWAVPIGVLYYDGFIDWTSTSKDKRSSMNFTSQLKYNLGDLLNTENRVYIGVEYVYWRNKFGIKGVDENNVNLLFKYHF